MALSRDLAEKAQKRESVTTQPKEHLTGVKGTLTMKNYLGGYYYLTCDEVKIQDNEIHLIEGKHTKEDKLPSRNDIKDGLLKMMLFTNLENLTFEEEEYIPVPILKLTTGKGFGPKPRTRQQANLLTQLRREAETNKFRVQINDEFFV